MLDNIFEIIKDDFNALIHNPLIIVILVAMMLIPSLYGLCNTGAFWDPSEGTSNLNFAIVNNDDSINVSGNNYNFGTNLVDNLKNNDNYNWSFVDENQARDGVKNGDYVAAIIIPSNYTESIVSIIGGQSSNQAEMEYVVNDKSPASLPTMTNASAVSIQNEVNDEISKVINNQTMAKMALATGSSGLSASTMSSGSASAVSGANVSDTGELLNTSVAPVKLVNTVDSPSDNFGSSVYPFYVSLSLWVGCLVVCALMNLNPMRPVSEKKYEGYEAYFGKLVLPFIMAIIQAIFLIIGTFSMGIQIADPLLFSLVLIFVSVVCMVISYSLCSALGNVGKLLTVIFLVLQVGCTGGIYPIDVTTVFSGIFKAINPYLPLTYGIPALREVMFGIIWPNLTDYLLKLVIFLIVFVIIGLAIKSTGFVDRGIERMNKMMKNSGLF